MAIDAQASRHQSLSPKMRGSVPALRPGPGLPVGGDQVSRPGFRLVSTSCSPPCKPHLRQGPISWNLVIFAYLRAYHAKRTLTSIKGEVLLAWVSI